MTCHPQMPLHPAQEISGLVKDLRAEEAYHYPYYVLQLNQPRPISWKTWGHLEGGGGGDSPNILEGSPIFPRNP